MDTNQQEMAVPPRPAILRNKPLPPAKPIKPNISPHMEEPPNDNDSQQGGVQIRRGDVRSRRNIALLSEEVSTPEDVPKEEDTSLNPNNLNLDPKLTHLKTLSGSTTMESNTTSGNFSVCTATGQERVSIERDSVFEDDGFSSDEFSDYDEDEGEDEEGKHEDGDKEPIDKKLKTEMKRRQVIQELFKTEENYVSRLLSLIMIISKLEGALGGHRKAASLDLQGLLETIQAIYKLHNESILPAIKQRVDTWTFSSNVSDVFLKYGPFLKTYTTYTSHLDQRLQTINNLQKGWKKFDKCLEDIKTVKSGKLDLRDLLVEPLQRIPRYKILLERYSMHLDPNDEEYSDIMKALTYIDDANRKFESVMYMQECFGELHGIEKRLMGFTCTVETNPNRKFIKEGPVTRLSGHGNKTLARYLFLFSDVLVVTAQVPRSDRHIVKFVFQLDKTEVKCPKALFNVGYDEELLIMLQTFNKAVILMFTDAEETNAWNQVLRETVSKCSSEPTRLQSIKPETDDFSVAPVWMPDPHSTACLVCKYGFNFTRRRHHCRGCGILVCNSCSSHVIHLPYNDFKAARVCDFCFVKATKQFPHLLTPNKVATLTRKPPASPRNEQPKPLESPDQEEDQSSRLLLGTERRHSYDDKLKDSGDLYCNDTEVTDDTNEGEYESIYYNIEPPMRQLSTSLEKLDTVS